MIKFKYNPTKNQRTTSEFGKRDFAGLQFHSGIDFGAITPGVEGDELYAVADGIVKVSKADSGNKNIGYGYYIVIEHEGYCTLYAHLQKLELKVGDKVKAGQIIGHMGNTGESTAAHLHFEVRNCTYNNPYFWSKGTYTGQFIMCINPVSYFVRDMTVQEAEKIVQERVGLDDNTMQYLKFYRYGDTLLLKLAGALDK
ncbi:M23 family metallopeptidase [Sedimentibacter sp.]|uniref:M23 family metallopeptidase n=1 Tax=Sedimentibacter sp. TaxID=1960295 RepID=UPI0028B08AFC|nr:M23 family metallopeptidase [Sedimentibacter sp.]